MVIGAQRDPSSLAALTKQEYVAVRVRVADILLVVVVLGGPANERGLAVDAVGSLVICNIVRTGVCVIASQGIQVPELL